MTHLGCFRKLASAIALLAIPACAAQPELAVAYREYTLPLASYVPTPSGVAGVLLHARINGGPTLRLLLDTGAADVVLDAKAAQRSGLSTSANLVMVCAGGSPRKTMKAGLARTVDIGPVSFRNCAVDVAPGKLGEGLDGVIPMFLFRGFLVRLDLRRNIMELNPYLQVTPNSTEGFAHAMSAGHLLFVPATLDRAGDGYVLIDTGSSYTAVSRRIAQAMKGFSISSVSMRAGNGAVPSEYITPGVRFRIAGREIKAGRVLAIDLSAVSHYSDLELAGLLGYPDLRSGVLTVNYRDLLVKIEPGP